MGTLKATAMGADNNGMSNSGPPPGVDSDFSIFDTIPNPIFVKDESLRYLFVNESFESFYGISRSAIIGRSDASVFHDRDIQRLEREDEDVIAAGGTLESRETVRSDHGFAREVVIRKSRHRNASGNFILVGILHDVTEIARANERLEASQSFLHQQSRQLYRLATTDPLTECYNRRALFEAVEQREKLHTPPVCLLILDIDHFKTINDNSGHAVGDAVLVHFAHSVRSILRPQDMFVRFGGDEFAVLMPATSRLDGLAVAERIRRHLAEKPLQDGDAVVPLTVSIGVAGSEDTDSGVDLPALLRNADEALYRAKNDGRNLVRQAQ
ncbi:GGDEF domain-containing protein [Algicella marina]|uniref:diguanylate cyclase n=1 Tax=Algicella marina TaxID=2683284 RepID=A0A6P1T158_9RHOB|nr:GGDEF domain-containing protein [Algicella marina]QHQ36644.1 diguanylate cyclase [Algicella marina]